MRVVAAAQRMLSRRRLARRPELLQAVRDEVHRTYATFLFRAPAGADLERHLSCLAGMLPDPDTVMAAAADGTLRRFMGIRPLKLEMDIVNQCNLRCVMCHFSNPEFYRARKQDISVDAFARIADQVFPLCSQVSLSISTEPLMHRRLAELLAVLPAYKVPLYYLHTNGLLLDEDIVERFIDTGFNQLSISVDGATAPTYERIRAGGKFSRLITNIRALNAAKARRRSSTPRLFFNVVLMRSNVEELPAIVRLASENGITGVAAVHLVPFEQASIDAARESLVNEKALCNRMLDDAAALAARLGVDTAFPARFGALAGMARHRDLTFLRPGEHSAPAACCPFPWHFIGISPSGSVAPCGWWHSEPLGNIHEEPFEALWTRAFGSLRAEHERRALRTNCLTCPSAGTGSVDDAKAFALRRMYS
jgi:radical SAM protein with 4Fe4S-binding SPASM domain